MNKFIELLSVPQPRHPKEWRPAFLAMQLGFIAGGFGLLGRDLLIFLSVENWVPIIGWELLFASIIGAGFILHTIGFAAIGVVIACVAGVASATCFIVLTGWATAFYLWYVNLAVLILAVPIRGWIKWSIAISFIAVYSTAYLLLAEIAAVIEIPTLTKQILGVSNIVGALLILGLPMGLYSKFLIAERERSERLLHNIMPKEIADRLKGDKTTIALENPEITVLMADIVNFTAFSDKVSADEVVKLLDGIFSQFDDVVEKFGVEKIKTIGDSYMIVAGIPQHREDHARVLYQLSFELRRIASEFVDDAKRPIKIRIGLNSGPAVSGVIGKTKFAFDVWGDTINTAARLEAHGEPDKVHMSECTYQLIRDDFELNLNPTEVFMKGKGNVKTYLF
jgi:class 3 adenylate cyclase